MKYNSFMILRYKKISQPVKCIRVFLSIIFPAMMILVLSRSYFPLLFQPGLLFTGWFTWTFAEYMLHRFGHHSQNKKKHTHSQELHQHHHTHPTEIKVTPGLRLFLFALSSTCLWLSFMLNNYFTFLCGIVCGIALFFFMHYILHHKWSAKFFPRLHRFHIYHHCKFPDRCHGISVHWWDYIFGTVPEKQPDISKKVLAFYYKKSSAEEKEKSEVALITTATNG